MIRSSSEEYRKASEEHNKKTKLSASPWFNCVKTPIMELPDETLVITHLAPMELHLMSSNFNRLFDATEQRLHNIAANVRATDWNTQLGFQRPQLHGGQFKGGQCSKMLGNINILKDILESQNLRQDKILDSLILAFEALKDVKDGCFGLELSLDYKEKIQTYKERYMSTKLKVSPKAHALFVHVSEFLDLMEEEYPNKGLGFWSEQASESVHYDFKEFWEKGYKLAPVHKSYGRNLLNAMIVYNSRHTSSHLR